MVSQQKQIRRRHQDKKATPVKAMDPSKWWKKRNTLLQLILVLALTFIVMSPSLRNDFVNWDDDVNVYENNHVQLLTAQNVQRIFTSTVIGNYNPLTILTFAVEHHFFGLNPFYYHLDNLILHLICTLLVFWLMLLLGVKIPWALFIALLFGIQPMRVESVAWITERKDVLFGSFYLASLLSYAYYLKGKKKSHLLLTYVFFVPALLAKIQAVTLPLSMLLVDYLLNRPLKLRLIIEKIPYFILSLAVGLIGIYFLREQESLDQASYSIIERLLIGTYSLMVYIAKSIFPYEMSAIYPFPKPGEFKAIYYLSPIVILGLAYLVYRSARHSRRIVFGSLFFFFNIAFLLQVVNAGQGFIADRFTYIPYIGLFYIYGTGLSWLYDSRRKLRPVVMAVALIAPVVYAVMSWERVKVWSNTETLFTDVLEKDRNVAVAYNNRGRYYRENRQFDKAIDDFTRLMSIRPEEAKTYVTRGRLYFDMGQIDKANTDFNKALELDPGHAEALANRGAVHGIRKEYQQALDDLNQSLSLEPESAHALSNRSLVFFETGQYEEALRDCEALYDIKPQDHENINMMAVCKVQLGNFKGALEDYERAIKLKPEQGIYYQNRSFAYQQLGEKQKALDDIRRAQQLGVRVDPAYLESLAD